VFEGRPGLSNARNAAIEVAKGDYIVFTDDDVLVDESWLAECVAATLAFPDAVAIGGVIDPWFPEQPDSELAEVFPALKKGFCGLDHQLLSGPLADDQFIFGANMAFRRDALHGIRFDPEFGYSPTTTVASEEIELLRRLRASGGVIVWWPKMRVRHYVLPERMTLAYLLKHTAGRTETLIRLEGATPYPTWFAVPRWVWRECVRTYHDYLMLTLRRNRKEALMSLREHFQLRGMIKGYRAVRALSSGG
jgi:glycosyltransferase involved in cell wall biosynthesis